MNEGEQRSSLGSHSNKLSSYKVLQSESFYKTEKNIGLNNNSEEWTHTKKYCWSHCGRGSCDYCNNGAEKGYCCRKDWDNNGDCPMSAVDSIPDDVGHHTCMSRKLGLSLK